MKSYIIGLSLPQKYSEEILKMQEGLDNVPDYIDYIKAGFSSVKIKKINTLIRIESLKKYLENNECSEKEKIIAENTIFELIDEYNKI